MYRDKREEILGVERNFQQFGFLVFIFPSLAVTVKCSVELEHLITPNRTQFCESCSHQQAVKRLPETKLFQLLSTLEGIKVVEALGFSFYSSFFLNNKHTFQGLLGSYTQPTTLYTLQEIKSQHHTCLLLILLDHLA